MMIGLFLVVVKAVAPVILAGGLVAAGSVVGGLLNRSAQGSANASNRAIANKTNRTNIAIAREQNEYNLQMMREQMQYLSPAEQRRMLEEAGYSPYAYLLTNGTGTPGLAQSAGLPQQFSPSMIPETGLGDAVAQAGTNFGNVVSSLADADLKSAQAEGQRLENSVFSERTKLSFDAMRLHNAYQRVCNDFAGQEKTANIDLLKAQKLLTDRQCDQISLNNEIQSFYKDKIQPKELEELNKRINLLLEQGKSQISLREYYSAMGHSALVQADASKAMASINGFLSKYQARLMAMQALDAKEHASLNKAVADGQINQNSLQRVFGVQLTQAQIDMLQSSKGVNEAMIEKVYTENEQLQKNLSWTEFNNLVGALVPLGIVGKIFGIGTSPITISGFGR